MWRNIGIEVSNAIFVLSAAVAVRSGFFFCDNAVRQAAAVVMRYAVYLHTERVRDRGRDSGGGRPRRRRRA